MDLVQSFKNLPLWGQITIGGATILSSLLLIGEIRNNHLIQQSAENSKKETGPEWVRRKMKPYRMDPKMKQDAEYVFQKKVSVFADDEDEAYDELGYIHEKEYDILEVKDAESFEAPVFSPSDDDDDKEFNPYDEYNCHVCDRPYEFSKIARSLSQHYLKESDGGEKDWYHSKSNPDGVRRTARNIAGYELYYYGMQALEHYMAESKPSKLRDTVIELLRKATVPNVIIGDVVQFIETLEIDGVDDLEPRFSKDFSEDMAAESQKKN